jgi:hypothetical protein
MKQSHSREANSHSSNQHIPRISHSPNERYFVVRGGDYFVFPGRRLQFTQSRNIPLKSFQILSFYLCLSPPRCPFRIIRQHFYITQNLSYSVFWSGTCWEAQIYSYSIIQRLNHCQNYFYLSMSNMWNVKQRKSILLHNIKCILIICRKFWFFKSVC